MKKGCGLCKRYGHGCQYHPDEPHETAQQKKRRSTRNQRAQRASQDRFLAAFVDTGTVTHAAQIAGIGRRTHYDWMDGDEEYADRFQQAEEAAADELEREARRRALEGVEEPVGWHKGEPGGVVTRYSDTLLMFLLNGRRSGVFRNRHEVTGKDGGPIVHRDQTIDPSKLSTATLRAIKRDLEAAREEAT